MPRTHSGHVSEVQVMHAPFYNCIVYQVLVTVMASVEDSMVWVGYGKEKKMRESVKVKEEKELSKRKRRGSRKKNAKAICF